MNETEDLDNLGLYLRDIRNLPLLSPEQERNLAKTAFNGRLSAEELCRNHHNPHERQRFEELTRKGEAASQQLVASNLRLVVKIAKLYQNLGVSLPDLIQEGNIGLAIAVERFDYHRRKKLSWYARWWIFKFVLEAIASQGKELAVPRRVCSDYARLLRTRNQLAQELGEEPSRDQLIERLGISKRRFHYAERLAEPNCSLENCRQLQDNHPDPLVNLGNKMRQTAIDSTLATLGAQEELVLRLRFGLRNNQDEGLTLEQTGQKLGVSHETIRHIEIDALQKLRHPSRALKIRDYLDSD